MVPLLRVLVWLLAAWLAGCASLPDEMQREMDPPTADERSPFAGAAPAPEPARPVRPAAVRSLTAPAPSRLVSGQLLVWSNPGATGLFVGLFAESFSPWTHIGVIAVEPDGVFVYDANASLQISTSGPATASGGGVQRIAYSDYVDSDRIYGLYAPPPGVDVATLMRFVRSHHRQRTPFDPSYDSGDASALYCSELLALGFAAAGAEPLRPVPVRRHRSYDRLRAWLGVSSGGFYLPGQLIDERRRVAVWGRGRNLAQIETLFAARHEIARRFDPTTRLGHLMQWNAMSLSLAGALDWRDLPRRFVEASEVAHAGIPDEAVDPGTIQREVARLADRYLGHRPGR